MDKSSICGIIFNEGVMIGSNFEWRYESTINKDFIFQVVSVEQHNISELLSDIQSEKLVNVKSIVTVSQRYIENENVNAQFIFGGVDHIGKFLYHISNLTMDQVSFAVLGHDIISTTCLLESKHKDDLTQDQALDVLHSIYKESILNVTIITNDAGFHLRDYKPKNLELKSLTRTFQFPAETTPFISEKIDNF